MKLNHCLVTGAAGFIGSHLVDRLLAQGITVVGLDNLKLGRRENLSAALAHPRFRFYEADLNDLAACRRILGADPAGGSFEAVWHLAANSDIRAGVSDPDVDLRDTFLTTHNTLRLMREFRIPRIAFASTSAIYGQLDRPLTEDIGPLFPISNYGAMKLASEAAISAALESYLDQAWIFRFPNVIGGRATHGAIYDFVQKLKRNPAELEVLGDGTQEKPYFHVSELLDAMLFIVGNATEKLNVFNLGTLGSATTVRRLAETVVAHMAPGATIRYGTGNKGWVGDVPKFNYSTERLRRLGWTPKLTSDEALVRSVVEIVNESR